MDVFVGVRSPNPYGREDLEETPKQKPPTKSTKSRFYQTHVIYFFAKKSLTFFRVLRYTYMCMVAKPKNTTATEQSTHIIGELRLKMHANTTLQKVNVPKVSTHLCTNWSRGNTLWTRVFAGFAIHPPHIF